MFIALVDGILPVEIIQHLSPGAAKLFMAVQAEPNASQRRYMELVGRCERSVRLYGRELLEFGLVDQTIGHSTAKRGKTPSLPRAKVLPKT